VILEPDNVSRWNGTLIGQAIVAAAARLSANGFTPRFIAPSNTNMSNAITYFDDMIQVAGVLQYLEEFSYHRYGGVSDANLLAIADRAVTHGVNTSMLEWWFGNSTYHVLHKDVGMGRNSAWQGEVTRSFFAIDSSSPGSPVIGIADVTRFNRQYYKFVRRGAVRIEAGSDDAALDRRPAAGRVRCQVHHRRRVRPRPPGCGGERRCGPEHRHPRSRGADRLPENRQYPRDTPCTPRPRSRYPAPFSENRGEWNGRPGLRCSRPVTGAGPESVMGGPGFRLVHSRRARHGRSRDIDLHRRLSHVAGQLTRRPIGAYFPSSRDRHTGNLQVSPQEPKGHSVRYSTRLCAALAVSLATACVVFSSVTVQYGSVLFTLDTGYHGVNYPSSWDDLMGSEASREAIRRAGVDIVRFPGGEPADYFDWQTAGGAAATTYLGTYAQAAGAVLMFQTNAKGGNGTDDSPQHAADWVSYCNTNGIDVAFWEIGNEPEIDITMTHNPTTDRQLLQPYFDTFNAQSAAMKAVDGSITVMGPVGTNANFWCGDRTLEMFLDQCDANTDAVSLHWYNFGGEGGTAAQKWAAIMDMAQEWQSYMNYVRGHTSKPVYMTEWSAIGDGLAYDHNTMVMIGLVHADVIGAYARSGVAGHCMFGSMHQVYNGWGILHGAWDFRGPEEAGPQYFALALWNAMGNLVLDVSNTSNAASQLSAWAHKKTDGSVQVMLINKTSSARSETVSFNGYNPAGKQVHVYEFRSASANPADQTFYYNETVFDGAGDVQPCCQDLPGPTVEGCVGSTFTRSLPPYSATVLDFTTAVAAQRRVLSGGDLSGITVDLPERLVRVRTGNERSSAVLAVVVIDLQGNCVKKLAPNAEGAFVWDAAGAPAGTYVVRLCSESGWISKVVPLP
jgi:hypothetical protein